MPMNFCQATELCVCVIIYLYQWRWITFIESCANCMQAWHQSSDDQLG